MPTFSYKAADQTGKVVQSSIEATDQSAAVSQLQKMGFIPIRVQSSKNKINLPFADLSKRIRFARVSKKDVMLITQDLAALLEAGLPVDRALGIMMKASDNQELQTILEDILQTVEGGGALSDALARHPKTFSRFYVNMVRAGEAGGVLEPVLNRMGDFLETMQELRESVTSALIYPLFVVSVGGISIIILMTYVIPKFSMIFNDMGGAIPLSTQFLLAVSSLLQTWWPLLLGLLAITAISFRRIINTPKGRMRMDTILLKTPLWGDLIRKLETARFARTLGTLLQSGVPILQALSLVQDIMSNKVITESLQHVQDRVKKGERLSAPLEDTSHFPSLAVQMITVGEETGKLDTMLMKVAESYEKIVQNLVKRFISLLEPALILFMGLVVGFIVISMLMAIFSMNDLPI